jgi:phospholipid/cholesterol/gamma-HCH transport system substrate-binding protein
MQDSRINYVVVGVFVTAMLAALIVALSVLSGRTGATDTYYTVYDNVTGLKYGTVVLYEGYQIGQVDTIEPMAGSAPPAGPATAPKTVMFKVIMKVRKGWHIPEDSVARAAVSGLLSAMTIDIRGGQSEKLIPPGGQIRGISASNFFATLSELSAQFGDLSNESLKPMLNSLNHLIGSIDRSVNDNLPAILKDVQSLVAALAKDAPAITASLRRSSEIVEKDLLRPENRDHIAATLANVETTTANIAKLSAELEETRKVIHNATVSIDKVVQANAGNIDESLRDLRYTLGTAARYVDDIAQNASATARNMAEFSHQIRDNPGLFLRGSPPPDESQRRK